MHYMVCFRIVYSSVKFCFSHVFCGGVRPGVAWKRKNRSCLRGDFEKLYVIFKALANNFLHDSRNRHKPITKLED